MNDMLIDSDLEMLQKLSNKDESWTLQETYWVKARLRELVNGYGAHSHPNIPAASEEPTNIPNRVNWLESNSVEVNKRLDKLEKEVLSMRPSLAGLIKEHMERKHS